MTYDLNHPNDSKNRIFALGITVVFHLIILGIVLFSGDGEWVPEFAQGLFSATA